MSDKPGRNLLPLLRGAGIRQGTIGAWGPLDTPEELTKLDFGDYEEQGLRTRIQSIPSPWARLLLFKNALQDEEHPARELVASELLDALEFLWSHESRPGSGLEWATVRLDELVELAQQTQSVRAQDFAAALVELAPFSVRGPRAASMVDTIVIGMVQRRPVVASSPFTGLFTTEDAAGEGTGMFFRYMREGVYRSLAQRPRAFQRYIAEVLVPQLSEHEPPAAAGNPEWPTLRRTLGAWLKREAAAAQLASTSGDFRIAAQRAGLEPFEVSLGGLALYHRRPGAELENSRWRLRTTRATDRTPLIIDPASFDGEYYEGAQRVRLASFSSADRETLPGLGEEYPWVYPATDWLSEKVLLLNEPLERENVRGLARYEWRGRNDDPRFGTPRMTIPLKGDFFRYFSPDDVDRMLSIQVQPSGDIEVLLRIPAGTEDQPHEVAVRKVYSAAEREEPGPGLALWPSFHDDRWHHYLVFRQDSNRELAESVDLVPIGSSGNSLGGERVRRTELVTALALTEAPAALEFRRSLGGANRAGQSFGVVLPRFKPLAPASGASWHVGVDFGTSNTVISIRENGADSGRLFDAQSMTLRLTEPGETTRPLMDAYFFPEELAARPFGTAVVHLKDRPDVPFSEEPVGARITVPYGGHVYQESRNRVVGDLKWSADRDTYYLSSSFLRHVLATVVAAAVQRGIDPSRISFSWAYPRAFTPTQRDYLASQWEQVIRSLRDVGVRPDAVHESLDESRSVLRHFFNLGQVHVVGEAQAVLDVGGGTTDIAAYGGGRVLLLDSVMLGGRNLTGPALRPATLAERVNPFVYVFFRWAVRHHLPEVEKEVVEAYLKAGQIHLAFSYLVGTKWFEEGRAAQFAADPAFHHFQLIVLYCFGALMHYLGLSFRANAGEDGAKDVFLPHSVVIAGNGSRYLDWLTNLRPIKEGDAFLEVLSGLLINAAGLPETAPLPRIRVSTRPKHEVATGLVARTKTMDLDERGHAGTSLAGESFTLDGITYRPTSRLRTDEVIRPNDVARIQLDTEELEVERYHQALISAVERLTSYGGAWENGPAQYAALLKALDRRDLRQEVVGRLGYLAQKEGGFQGSIFILEVATVVEKMLQGLFPREAR